MLNQSVLRTTAAALIGLMLAAASVDAQDQERRQRRQGRPGGGPGRGGGFPGGGFGGGFRGGLGPDALQLAAMPEVQKEVEMLDDQKESVRKLVEEARSQRGENRGGFQNFREMSQEERQQAFAEMQKRAAERAKESEGKLAGVLLPHQLERIKEIQLQAQGVGALRVPEVAAKLNIDEAQQKKIEAAAEEAQQTMRAKMGELFRGGGGGDRDAMRAEMEKLRKESEEKVLAALSEEQRTQFAELKGEAFELPRMRGGRFGGGRPGGRGRPGGGGRPNRPERPERPARPE